MFFFIKHIGKSLLLVFVLCLAFSCDDITDDEGDINPILTIEHEKDFGDKIHIAIRQNTQTYKILNPVSYGNVYKYVDSFMTSVINANRSNIKSSSVYNWQVIILQNDNIKGAFTAPGGRIYIYTGLLKFIDSESELLAVLAQQISYGDRSMQVMDSALSPVMSLIKTKYIANESLGTKKIIDIIKGTDTSDLLKVISSEFLKLSFPQEKVKAADEFTHTILCGFSWNAKGLGEILRRVRSVRATNFQWLENHPPAYPSMDTELQNRIFDYELLVADCGANENAYKERYNNSLKKLLP